MMRLKLKPFLLAFSQLHLLAGNLKRHMRNVHEGRKDFECSECGKKFKQLQSLKGKINPVF